MKVQIKDLKPNPFRDMKNYPINEGKVKSLTNSINQTGFWDNILARKNNGKIEIAYGHHRLVVLKKLFKPDDYVDIPVKELDDPTMIRIMANENMNEWETNIQIIDETIKVTKNYLLNNPNVLKKILSTYNISLDYHVKYEVPGRAISEFLGSKLWIVGKITESLRRLKLEKEGNLDKKAVENLPSDHAARSFTRQIENSKNITLKQQKRASKRIIERQDFSESGIKSALLDEKYKGKEKGKEERDFIEFKNYVMGCTKEINTLNGKLGKLLLLEEELKPDMLLYRGSIEARDFDSALRLLISIIKEFLGKGKTECQKQVVSK